MMRTKTYKGFCFKFPKLTIERDKWEGVEFIDCDFRALRSVKLSGLEKVKVSDNCWFFGDGVHFDICNCKEVEFKNIDFERCSVNLDIIGAKKISFSEVYGTSGLVVSTRECNVLRYRLSSLCFDTSKIQVVDFDIGRTQISDHETLDMKGVSRMLSTDGNLLFGVQKILVNGNTIVKENLPSSISGTTKKLTDIITRVR